MRLIELGIDGEIWNSVGYRHYRVDMSRKFEGIDVRGVSASIRLDFLCQRMYCIDFRMMIWDVVADMGEV